MTLILGFIWMLLCSRYWCQMWFTLSDAKIEDDLWVKQGDAHCPEWAFMCEDTVNSTMHLVHWWHHIREVHIFQCDIASYQYQAVISSVFHRYILRPHFVYSNLLRSINFWWWLTNLWWNKLYNFTKLTETFSLIGLSLAVESVHNIWVVLYPVSVEGDFVKLFFSLSFSVLCAICNYFALVTDSCQRWIQTHQIPRHGVYPDYSTGTNSGNITRVLP